MTVPFFATGTAKRLHERGFICDGRRYSCEIRDAHNRGIQRKTQDTVHSAGVYACVCVNVFVAALGEALPKISANVLQRS